MKIGYLTSSLTRKGGGVYDAVRNLAISCKEKDLSVEVFGLIDDEAWDCSCWDNIKVHKYSVLGPDAFCFNPYIVHDLCQSNLDILHTHGLWTYPSIAALKWYRKSKRPEIITTHGMLDTWAINNSKWKKKSAAFLFEKKHLESASCLHALNACEAKSLREYGLKNPIAIVPNGVSIQEGSQNVDPPWANLIAKESKVMLFLGRIHPKKGLINLLNAWSKTKNSGINELLEQWHLVIAGWDQNNHRRELEEIVTLMKMHDKVHFIGPIYGDDKLAALSCANAFILPSQSEGLPIAILEAWSHSLPVLMTTHCNLPDGFTKGAAVCLDDNIQGLTHNLDDFMDMSLKEHRIMGEKGRALVHEKYMWDIISKETICVYKWLSGVGSIPKCIDLY